MRKTRQSIIDEAGKLIKKNAEKESGLLIESKSKLKKIKKENSQYKLVFPVEAFPQKMQDIINIYNECFGFPKDYYGLSFLTVGGAVLGNGFRAKYKSRWHTNALLYSAIVGPSSIGKSQVLNEAVYPVYQMEDDFAAKNQVVMQKFKDELTSWNNTRSKDAATKPEQPGLYEIFIDEITIESLYGSMKNNPKGLLYFKDELSAWINGMGQYKGGKGTEGEFWLKNWGGARVKISRMGKAPVFINKPCIPVLGALTPGFLTKLAEGGRSENGFLQRVLFAYPDNMDKPKEAEHTPDPAVFQEYGKIIEEMNKLPHNFKRNNSNADDIEDFASQEPVMLLLSEKARIRFSAYLETNRLSINGTDDDMVKSIYGKMDSYCLRFSLILELMGLACKLIDIKPDPNEPFEGATKGFLSTAAFKDYTISLESVENAILLSEYFKQTAFKVVRRFDSPVSRLNTSQRDFYKSLPDEEFTTKSAIELGKSADLGRATVERLLNNKEIFRRKSRGLYEKMYV